MKSLARYQGREHLARKVLKQALADTLLEKYHPEPWCCDVRWLVSFLAALLRKPSASCSFRTPMNRRRHQETWTSVASTCDPHQTLLMHWPLCQLRMLYTDDSTCAGHCGMLGVCHFWTRTGLSWISWNDRYRNSLVFFLRTLFIPPC